MRITIAYNLRTDDSEKTAELLSREDVERLGGAIGSLGHTVTEVEMSGKPNDVVDRLLASEPDLIFNVAEGTIGSSREAFYPGLYEQLGIPFTGGNASLLHLNLDKHLSKTVLASRGIRVPQGVLITKADQERAHLTSDGLPTRDRTRTRTTTTTRTSVERRPVVLGKGRRHTTTRRTVRRVPRRP